MKLILKARGYAPLGTARGREYTINDAAFGRVLAAYKALYGQVQDQPANPGDPNATPPVPPSPATMRDMTDAEVLVRMFDGTVDGILNNAHSHARVKAANDASAGVNKDSAAAVDDNT